MLTLSEQALLVLNMASGVGPVRVRQLLSVFERPEAILAASPEALSRVSGIGPRLAASLAEARQECDPDWEWRRVQRAGAEIVFQHDDDYPELLRQIHDPPLLLYVQGSRRALRECAGALAMVGSRHTTVYGRTVAERLAFEAAKAGIPVVSGLARGIDTYVHEAVLQHGGRTLAVIGSGLGHLYPPENIPLASRIAESGGAVLTEFPMDFRPDKRTFPMRNRIISGMTAGTVVVEAGDNSGSLITAASASQQGRLVFAVPGRVDSPLSRGCHALIRDGATLIEGLDDVRQELSQLPGLGRLVGRDPGSSASSPAALSCRGLNLSDLEVRIVRRLVDGGEMSVDGLVADLEAFAGPGAVLAALVSLEMRRLVWQRPGKRVAAREGLVAD